MPVNAGDTRSGTAPLESAPATRCASCLTIGAGNAMPRRVSSTTLKRAVPGRSIVTGPAMRSGSVGFRNPANGPSASRGITRVSSRQYTATAPSSSSTRSESKLLRTDQSIPLPTIAATSFADSTTESGPARRSRRSTFVWVLERAFGVGAPTAVSATGGSLVECGPNQRAPVRRIGSRNHHAASPATTTRQRVPSRTIPLKQPLTVPDLLHRASRLEHPLHQVPGVHERRLLEVQPRERALQASDVAG